jgi:23S rRNA pseudouridine955/2504/2580 synthase
LDNFLLRQLKGVPKAHVYRIIRSGEVRLNQGRVGANARLQTGDAIRVPPLRLSKRMAEKAQAMRTPSSAAALGHAFDVLLEDEVLLALHKPAGVAVHGGSGVSFGVIEQLRMARPELPGLELVHRLDRDTSGILLIAKKRSALKILQDQFRARHTHKTYLAMVNGHWPATKKVLDQPLHKYLLPDGQRRVQVVAQNDPAGRPSITLVQLKASSSRFSLLEIVLKTGRTHQIRVHLASAGHPILGDDKYGDFELNKQLRQASQQPTLKRMFLHAWRLQFDHPTSGQRISLEAPLAADLAAFRRHTQASTAA